MRSIKTVVVAALMYVVVVPVVALANLPHKLICKVATSSKAESPFEGFENCTDGGGGEGFCDFGK